MNEAESVGWKQVSGDTPKWTYDRPIGITVWQRADGNGWIAYDSDEDLWYPIPKLPYETEVNE